MCGIAGIVWFDGAPAGGDEIAAMAATLTHRGPDDSGTHLGDGVALGHTRLAVMDPTPAGHQPMAYGDGRYWITYNGEVYNFLELRETLEGLGHRFHGESDTEVLVAAYAEWGADCQLRLNGEWAFAIWDAREKTLFASRDRFGVKPLFYAALGGRFVFASEMKAFLALAWFEAAFDERAVATALTNFQAFEGMEPALLRGVKRLAAGHQLTLSQGAEPAIARWWRTLDHLTPVHPAPKRRAEHLRELLFDACALRMRSDIPIGTAVSGGLDSSAIHCAMAHVRNEGRARPRQAKSWDRAIVGLLPGWADDDKALAEDVIRYAGTRGIFKQLRPEDALAHLDDLIFHFEQIAPLPIGQWLLYRELRRNDLVVSMEGHGADDAFAGYRGAPRVALYDGFEKLHGYVDAMNQIGASGATESADSNLLSLVNQLPPGRTALEIGKMRSSEYATATPYPLHNRAWDEDVGDLWELDALTRTLYLEFHCSKLPWILHDFETASMANGIEIRMPFLDWRIVCYAFSLPLESKIGKGYSKYLIRESMRGFMPENVRTQRKKIGFPLPLYAWLGETLKPYLLDRAASRRFLESALWDGPAVRARIEAAYANGNTGDLRYLWSYIQADQLVAAFGAGAAS